MPPMLGSSRYVFWRSERSPTRPFRFLSLRRGLVVLVLFCLLWRSFEAFKSVPVGTLTHAMVKRGQDVGSNWYIPPSWLQNSATEKSQCLHANPNVLEAAECAVHLAQHRQEFLNNTRIPLIIHQTWRDLAPESWNGVFRKGVEAWLRTAVGDGTPESIEMAYFLWDDEGIQSLIETYEPELYTSFNLLPYPVEKSDVFRVVVLKWFGGVYADMDTEPLKHPHIWIEESDLTPWIDTYPGKNLTVDSPRTQTVPVSDQAHISRSNVPTNNATVIPRPPVSAIFGIEADNPPEPDTTYWRMGYSYPVQITNWALSMAPHHPVADQFLLTLTESLRRERHHLSAVDPLLITGPPALTAAVKNITEEKAPGLSWDALSSRNVNLTGGRSKVVAGNVLILPITGFNPGRGWFHNMGSQSIAHENARLRHAAVGSWRVTSPKVHYGKLCRTLFGLCRDWKKIPE